MKRIVLVGQPNSGKSSLFNCLVGHRAVISNYPGTTVEIMQAKAKLNGMKAYFIDTPGIYSLSDSSLEERVAKEAILDRKVDLIIDIVDASSLEKGLFFTMQLLEAGLPLIVALNFYEEAQDKGILVDAARLATILGVPVTVVNPLTRRGFPELIQQIRQTEELISRGFIIDYDDDIEGAISRVEKVVRDDAPFPKRFVTIRSLEGDPDLQQYLNSPRVLEQLAVPNHPNLKADIVINRHGVASYIARIATSFGRRKEKKHWEERLDWLLLHPRLGLPIAFFTFLALFGALLYLGGAIQDALSVFVDAVIVPAMEGATAMLPFYLETVLKNAVTGTSAGIAIAIPYIFLFYLILALLEDFGILPRLILSLDRVMRRLDLPGNAIIPMLLGLGCSVPATTATRILSTRQERLKVMALFSVIPCSSRTAIILGVVGHYAGTIPALGIYAIAFLFLIGAGYLLKFFTRTSPPPLLLELPPYRRPRLSNVLVKGWLRMRGFVYVVIPMLILGGAAYGLLKAFNLDMALVNPLRFFTVDWLHLPKETITPLLYGFLQKDLTPAMLVSVAGTMNLGSFMTPLQIFTFGIASTFQIPCIIVVGMMGRELGWRMAIMITIVAFVFWMIVSGIILRTGLLLGGLI